MSRSQWLATTGGLMTVGYVGLLFFQPFSDHVKSFLALYSALFFVFFALVLSFKTSPPPLDIPRGSIVLLVLYSLAFRLIVLATPPSLSDDIFRYVWDGRVQQAGINPYRYAPSAPELAFLRDNLYPFINHRDIPTVYPPLAQIIFRCGVALKSSINIQRFIFFLFDFASVIVLMLLLSTMKRSPLWSLIYAWNPLVVIEFVGSGHNDSAMIFFLLLSFLFFARGKNSLSYVGFALASLSKLIPLVMIPWMLARRQWRRLLLFGGLVLAGVAPFVIGPSTTGLKIYARDWVFNPGLYGLLRTQLTDPSLIKIILGSALVVFAAGCALRYRDNPLLYAFMCFYALLLCSPVVHPWYVTWLVPFLCFYPVWSGLAWSWLAGFSYLVLIRYHADGVWHLPATVQGFEYGVLYFLLGLETVGLLHRWRHRRSVVPMSWESGTASITIIIPALNEEEAIARVIESAKLNGGPKARVIVVDNGSTDRTAEVARALGVFVVMEPTRGYGRAVLTGLAQVDPDCEVVVILDGDHSDFPADLPDLLAPIERGEADMVMGSRTAAASPGSLQPQQRFGNWLTCGIIDFLYGRRFSDLGPFRAIRRSALDSLRMEDRSFGWNVEMQVKALQHGLRVMEVPVRYRPRIGRSKISGTIKGSLQAGVVILWAIYKYGVRWNYLER